MLALALHPPKLSDNIILISLTNSGLKIVTEKFLKKVYRDLLDGKVHEFTCGCASCLYHYAQFVFKEKKGKKIRSRWDSKDNFFLYWLAFHLSARKGSGNCKLFDHNKHRKHDWYNIINLYYRVTGQKRIREKQFETERPEYFRIISRLDKKYNIPQIEHAKTTQAIFFPACISPFLVEVDRLLDTIRKYYQDVDLPIAGHLPTGALKELFKEIQLAIKITFYLKKSKVSTYHKYRDLSRAFHISLKELLVLLDYLEQINIIVWDRGEKTVSLGPDSDFWLFRFLKWLGFIGHNLAKLGPYSFDDARKAFIWSAEKSCRP